MATLTISAAARLCHCDRRTLQRAIHAGRLHLDAQHCLSRDELIATSYLIVETPQETSHQTPRETPQGAALLPLLKRLAIAIEGLRLEIQYLREHQHQTPPEAPHPTPHPTPPSTPQEAPQGTPQPSPQILGLYDPRAAAIRIRDLRQQGLSDTLIAVQLTREGIPTRYGKPWEHSSVRYVLETYGPKDST